MAEQSTFIKLDRNIMRWRWWHDHNTLIVFLYLLINANIQDNGYKGVNIRRGEIACSFSTISQHANLTIQQVRTAILHLKSTGEITSTSYHNFQVITIVNYDKYQSKQHTKQHDEQHPINTQATSYQQQYKNIKNGKNGKNKKGRSAPDSPSGKKEMPKRDEGKVEDIPEIYKDRFSSYADYWDWRNQ